MSAADGARRSSSAVRDQLGLEVVDGEAGGSGSVRWLHPAPDDRGGTEDEPEHYLFAKLYAKSHVRADRWYKLGRTILYGALEDETPFKTVRRFVEYEDYTLRLMYDEGLPAPEPYGVVEITPEREYMIVMEFFEDSVEISEAEVDDHVDRPGAGLVRRMWDIGLGAPRHQARQPHGAARRAPPDRRVLRSGPTLSLATSRGPGEHDDGAGAAHGRSSRVRACAAILLARRDRRGVRRHAWRGEPHPAPIMMKEQGRDLLAEFRALAPARAPVRIQRWSSGGSR